MIKNTAKFDHNQLITIFGSKALINFPDTLDSIGVSTDSRTIENGNLFFALKGENFDAHDMLNNAFEKGASAAVVSKSWFSNNNNFKNPVIVVDDTLNALGSLASYYRNLFDIPILAIGGSNGKTTTKDMTAAVLAKKYNLLKTYGNLNNLVGVPLMIFNLKPEHEIAVLEIGTNQPGEIYRLSEMVSPTHGLITNIGKEHLEGFLDIEGVELEETFLYGHLRKHRNYAFINADDPRLLKYAELMDKKALYGQNENAEVMAEFELNKDLNPILNIKYANEVFTINMKTTGTASAYNAIAAVAAGLHFEVPVKDIIDALQEYLPEKGKGYGRMLLEKTDKYVIINDCYNANPPSMELALDSLEKYPSGMPKIAALGDMRELGENSITEHEEILDKALNAADVVLLYGNDFKLASKKFDNPKIHLYDDKNALADFIIFNYDKSAVLVKGSRGLAMEKVVEKLLQA